MFYSKQACFIVVFIWKLALNLSLIPRTDRPLKNRSLVKTAVMKKISFNTISLLISLTLFGQTERFDIANFVAPKDWQRLDSNGIIGFFDSKTTNSGTRFCQILLYPSHAGTGNAARDFNSEWNNRVVKKTGTKKKPNVQTEKTSDGWTAVRGYANITQKNVTYTTMLVSLSGFGKQMSVLVNLAGENYQPYVTEFFKHLDLNANSMAGQNSNSSQPDLTGRSSFANYIYSVPPGWTATQYPDGLVLTAPPSNTGERCNITLWPMRRASNNLQQDAAALFNEVFKDFEPKNGSTPASMIKGTSAEGWEYFITKQPIGLRGGDYQTMFGFVFVAKLGSELAAISGISKDPLVSSCFGLQMKDVWPEFFYSLQFKNWNQQLASPVEKKLPGVWTAATATASDRFAFASNGRFAGAAAAQRYAQISSTEMLRITDAYFGDGTYTINGNSIVLTYDSEKNNPEKGMLRIEQESRDGGRSWTNKLFLTRKSIVDGALYEVNYDKQQ
jgi:hypothetical protein